MRKSDLPRSAPCKHSAASRRRKTSTTSSWMERCLYVAVVLAASVTCAISSHGTPAGGLLQAGIKKGFVSGGSMAFTMIVMFCTYGLAFWFGSVLIADDREDLLADLGALECPNTPDFDVTCTQFYLDNQAAACKTFCEDVVFPCLLGETCHSGGNVVLVFFAVIIGAMAIGQATPSATSAAQAQVAAYQVFKVVDRVVPISAASGASRVLPG